MKWNKLFLTTCLLPGQMLFAQGPVIQQSADQVISIPENASWISDDQGVWFSDGLASFIHETSFKEYSRNSFVYKGFSGPAILKFHLRTDALEEHSFVLELRNTEIDKVQLLILEGDRIVWESKMIGDVFPFEERYFDYRTLAFPVSLEPHKSYTFLLGLEKQNRIINSLIELYTKPAWEQRKSGLHLIYGLFFGLFFTVVILAFSLFSFIRRKLYLYYGIYVICMILLLGCFHGFNYQYIFPNSPGLQQYFMLIVQFLSLIFGNLYAFQFLGEDRHAKWVRTTRSVLIGVYVFGLLNTIIHVDVHYNVEKVLNMVFILVEISNTIILAGLSIWYIFIYRSGAAVAFLVSFIFVGVAVFYTNLSFVIDSMNYIPIGHSLLLALAIEMIILTLYMIVQFKQVENEKIIAENQLVTERIKNQHAFNQGQEMEKKKVAIQLHDEVGSSLLALKHQLESIPETSKIRDQLIQLSREVRGLSHSLLPTTLQELGLSAAVKELVSSNGSIDVHFKELTPTGEIREETSIQIYRIIQELIKNSYQHADADNIFIQFVTEGETFEVHYEDDGKGFDTENFVGGIGMRSMHERAAMIKADINLESTPGKGMTAMVRVKV